MDTLPKFKYSPNCYENGVFSKSESEKIICQCCGNQTEYYYTSMYAYEDLDAICPKCIESGEAARKFDGSFIQDIECMISDRELLNKFFETTPGYLSWQGEYWLVHCNDLCEYIGPVGSKELECMGILDEVLKEYHEKEQIMDIEYVKKYLCKDGEVAGYLFRCLHCKKYRIWIDIA